uniref:Uncharacterized protein n=1 Tax=Arundo donax TaxID=35708 RepID=A0A0A9BG80_ARUDO
MSCSHTFHTFVGDHDYIYLCSVLIKLT